MVILMVLDAPYPEDIRVTKEANALMSARHEVHLLCTSKSNETDSIHQGIQIHRPGISALPKAKGIRDIKGAFTHRYPDFERAIQTLLVSIQPDVLHVHDLPLANSVIRKGKTNGVRVIMDLHENFPEAIKTWFVWRKSILIRLKNKIVFRYSPWLRYEKEMCKQADHVIAVVEEMKVRLVETHGCDENKITVVSNSESRDVAKIFEGLERPGYLKKDKFNLAYVGGLGPHRGIDTCIEGMPQILSKIPRAEFHIVGSSHPDVVEYLKSLAIKFGVTDKVSFHGHVPRTQALAAIKHCDLNLIPHHSNPHTDNTIPHKLFQCIASGKPTLVSNSAPLKRVLRSFGADSIFEAGKPESFADAVILIHSEYKKAYDEAFEMSTNYYSSNLTWEVESKKLLSLMS